MSDFEERARLSAANFLGKNFTVADRQIFVGGFIQGRTDAERELRAPGPCGVNGHTKADWVDEETQSFPPYCAACRREQELREALRGLVKYPVGSFGHGAAKADAERLLTKEVKAYE